MRKLFRNVLVPYDFSRHATEALRTAAELARVEGGRLTVLHVIPPFSRVVGIPPGKFPPSVLSAELAHDQLRRLDAVVAREVTGRDRPPAVCRVVVADPFRGIMDAAAGASSIVMGTLGRTGLSRMLIGSVAEKVVRHAPIPVLTVRPGGRRRRIRRARPRKRAA